MKSQSIVKYLILIMTVLITGCNSNGKVYGLNKAKHERLFKECLAAVPPGPQQTHYNDWDDVVLTCYRVTHEWKDDEIIGIVVESDYNAFPIVAFLPYPERESSLEIPLYEQAMNIIEDLKAGRLDPRKLAAKTKEDLCHSKNSSFWLKRFAV